jgi:hemerythrin
MPIMAWDEVYSVRHAAFDEHHRHLLDLINEFYEAIKAGRGENATPVVLQKLVDHAQVHFRAEENYMRAIGFPGLDQHRAEHLLLEQDLDNFGRHARNGEPGLHWRIFDFLNRWAERHFIESDQKYARFAENQGLDPVE